MKLPGWLQEPAFAKVISEDQALQYCEWLKMVDSLPPETASIWVPADLMEILDRVSLYLMRTSPTLH
jgi:hypothetical protein